MQRIPPLVLIFEHPPSKHQSTKIKKQINKISNDNTPYSKMADSCYRALDASFPR